MLLLEHSCDITYNAVGIVQFSWKSSNKIGHRARFTFVSQTTLWMVQQANRVINACEFHSNIYLWFRPISETLMLRNMTYRFPISTM